MAATTSPESGPSDLGRLAVNGTHIHMLQSSLAKGEMDASMIPRMLLRILKAEAWREFRFPESDEPHRWSYGQFKDFLESPRPKGCETKLELVRRLIKDTPAEFPFEEAIRGKPGGANNPHGRAGKPDLEIKGDNITLDSKPLLPFPSASKHPTGTSTNYALRCLANGTAGKPPRPDLLEKVKAGKISPNTAMVEAGFRRKAITIDDDPERAARRLKLHFKGERLERLIAFLVD